MQLFTLEQFIDIICEHIHKKTTEVSADTKLVDDLGINSITLVNIIADVSETHGVSFSDIDFESVETVAQIHDALLAGIDAG